MIKIIRFIIVWIFVSLILGSVAILAILTWDWSYHGGYLSDVIGKENLKIARLSHAIRKD